MTQREFEKRTWQNLSAEEYAAVERDYMGLPDEMDISKDQFCGLWLAAGSQKTEQPVAGFLLVTFRNENTLLREDVKYYKSLLSELGAEIKALKGGAA